MGEDRNYGTIYRECLQELKDMFRNKASRNLSVSAENARIRTREIWREMAVPHKPLPERGDKPMIHFGGAKNGQPIKHM